jgi:hypothetical protein
MNGTNIINAIHGESSNGMSYIILCNESRKKNESLRFVDG